MSRLRIHFFGLEPGRAAIPLAAALGVGAREKVEGADVRRFEALAAVAPDRYTASDGADADLWVYPHDYDASAAPHAGAAEAKRLGKPCVFFQGRDDATPCSPPHGVVWRESILASQKTPRERVLPAFADDLARELGGVAPRPWRPTPSVGFCGFVGSTVRRLWFRAQGRGAKVLGLTLRHRALRALEQTRGVETRFVRRSGFWGGAVSRFRGFDPEAKRRVRDEYVQNIVGSDYTLCLRGAGNFSYRLYETLALGRTPLFVDTDCELPFADQIDWRRHVVWVDQSDLGRIGERLLAFHGALTPEGFADLQRANRRLWEEFLRPVECYERVLRSALAEPA